MDLLSAATACLLFVAPAPCRATTPDQGRAARTETVQRLAKWRPLIAEASQRFGVPADWIRSVIDAESGGDAMVDGKPITSPKGAMGLMQLMPSTWQDMRRRDDLGDDPYDPHDNILAGTAYLRTLMDRFGSGTFAAYNAGPGRFAAYLDGSKPLPGETQNYLRRIESGVPQATIFHSREALFFVNSSAAIGPNVTADRIDSGGITAINSGSLFVPLSPATH